MTSFFQSSLSSKQKKRPVTEIEEERQEDENDCKKEWLDLVVKARLAKINELQPPPMNTWSFPDAKTGHAELDAFLRSEQQTKVLGGIRGLDLPTRIMFPHFFSLIVFLLLSSSVPLKSPSDRGKNTVLTVEKNRSYY